VTVAGVLLSGGIDSAVALHFAVRDCDETIAFHYNYGQTTEEKEKESARELAKYHGIELEEIDLDFYSDIGGGILEDKEYSPNRRLDKFGQSVGYVPMRNAVFLAVASAFLDERFEDEEIYLYIGSQGDDASDYPDCRSEFLDAMERSLNLSTQKNSINIRSLTDFTKKEVAEISEKFDVPLESTISCYNPKDGRPCGKCPACMERKEAGIFED